MSSGFTIEVLMAAYNNAAATRLALEGFLRQRDRAFSLVIADDGSGPAIGELAEEYRRRGLEVRHVWHEDRGFRKGLILNRAIASSAADYLIFVDNDCIPQSTFIGDHRARARRGYFAAARRIDLGPELADEFRAGKWSVDVVDSPWWLLRQAFTKRLRHAEHGLHLPWFWVRRWSDKPMGLLGANMAIWKADLLRVNGFDNEVPEGCGEETDLEWRLLAAGVQPGALLGRAGTVHLYHPTRRGSPDAPKYRLAKQEKNEWWARHGITTLQDA